MALAGWSYRRTITASRVSGAVSNYQIKILVGESSGSVGKDVNCNRNCKTDFSDLRFTKSDGDTLLDYYIESVTGTTPNQLATVWVEFDAIGTGATTFYMYYGNSYAAAYSNGANTFVTFNDFSSDTVGVIPSGFSETDTPANGTCLTIAGGQAGQGCEMVATATTYRAGRASITSGTQFCIEAQVKFVGNSEFVIWYTDHYIGAIRRVSTQANFRYLSDGAWNSSSVAKDGNWHKLKMMVYDTNKIDFWIDSTSYLNKTAINTGQSINEFGARFQETGSIDIDTVFIRNYVATEPTISAYGYEEELIAISNKFAFSDFTPYALVLEWPYAYLAGQRKSGSTFYATIKKIRIDTSSFSEDDDYDYTSGTNDVTSFHAISINGDFVYAGGCYSDSEHQVYAVKVSKTDLSGVSWTFIKDVAGETVSPIQTFNGIICDGADVYASGTFLAPTDKGMIFKLDIDDGTEITSKTSDDAGYSTLTRLQGISTYSTYVDVVGNNGSLRTLFRFAKSNLALTGYSDSAVYSYEGHAVISGSNYVLVGSYDSGDGNLLKSVMLVPQSDPQPASAVWENKVSTKAGTIYEDYLCGAVDDTYAYAGGRYYAGPGVYDTPITGIFLKAALSNGATIWSVDHEESNRIPYDMAVYGSRLYIAVAASSPPTGAPYGWLESRGIADGQPDETSIASYSADGGGISGGLLGISQTMSRDASGGGITGGLSSPSRMIVLDASGGIIAGGPSLFSRTVDIPIGGGSIVGGSNGISFTRALMSFGGGVTGGIFDVLRTMFFHSNGGGITGGAALQDMDIIQILSVLGSGGAIVGGIGTKGMILVFRALGGGISGGAVGYNSNLTIRTGFAFDSFFPKKTISQTGASTFIFVPKLDKD